MAALFLDFKKMQNDDKILCSTFYSHSKAETIFNESDIDDVLELIYSTVLSNIQKYLEQGSCWIIDSVKDHNIKFQSIIP